MSIQSAKPASVIAVVDETGRLIEAMASCAPILVAYEPTQKKTSSINQLDFMDNVIRHAPDTNLIFVDVDDGAEKSQNTSFVNEVNANFIVSFVCRVAASAPLFAANDYMANPFDDESVNADQTQEVINSYSWGKILIISAYSEQKRILEEKLLEVPHAELPPNLWSVRTIDDSPSHQAEIVICDFVRTEKPGFLTANERLAVLTTNGITPTPQTILLSTSSRQAMGLSGYPCGLGRQKRGLYYHTAHGLAQKHARRALIVEYNVGEFWQNSCISQLSNTESNTMVTEWIISSLSTPPNWTSPITISPT